MKKIHLLIIIITFAINSCVIAKADDFFLNNKQDIVKEKNELNFRYAFIEGVKFKLIGEYRKSIKWFKRCLTLDKTSSAVRFELANIYIINGDFNTAIQLLKDAVFYNSNNKWYKLQLANVHRQMGNIKQACEIYEELYNKDTSKLDYLYMELELFLKAEDWKSSLKVLNLIEDNRGVSELTSLEKFKIYTNLNKQKLARKELTRLIKKFPDNTEYLAMLASFYVSENNDEKALDVFSRMLNVNPDNGYIYFYIADYYKDINNIERYKEYVTTAFSKNNVDIEHKVQYLIKLYISSDDINIEKQFVGYLMNKLLKIYPQNISLLSLQVDIFKSEGHFIMARDIVSNILLIDKHQYKMWEELLLLDNHINDYKSIKSHSESAIQFFPDKPLPYLFNGLTLLLDKSYVESLNILLKGEKLIKDNNYLKSQFYSYIAEAYYNINNKKESFKYFDKTLEIDPNNISVLNNYSYYLAESNLALDKAESMISKCVKEDVDNPTYLDTYAWVLYKRKRYKEALFIIERVIELDKQKSPVLMEHYGDILSKNNMLNKAVKAWMKSKDYGNDSKSLLEKIDRAKLKE